MEQQERENLHQETGLAASTVADDDELPTEFSRHGGCCARKGELSKRSGRLAESSGEMMTGVDGADFGIDAGELNKKASGKRCRNVGEFA